MRKITKHIFHVKLICQSQKLLSDFLRPLFSHALSDGRCGVGQYITLALGLVCCRVGQQVQFPVALTTRVRLTCIVLVSSPLSVMSKGQGQFSCFHVLRVRSPPPTLSVAVLLDGPGMA